MSNLHNIKTSIPDMPVQGSRLVLQGRRRTRLRLRIFHSEKLCLHQKYLCFPGKLYNTQNVSLGQLYQLKQYRILGFYLLNGWPMSSLHWFSWRKRIKFFVVNLASQSVTCHPEGPGGSALLVAARVDRGQNVEKKKSKKCATHYLLCQCQFWMGLGLMGDVQCWL